MSARALPICACGCGEPVPEPGPNGGRPRRYATDNCRKKASRRRRSRYVWSQRGDLATIPTDPKTQQARTCQLVAELLEGQPPAPAIDQLGQALIELEQLAWTLGQLGTSDELQPQLQGAAGMLSHEIRLAAERAFPGVAA